MNNVYLLIGGNMGNRQQNLEQAIAALNNRTGTVVKQSAVYETAAWGKTDQQAFLNQALLLQTVLPADRLMEELLVIEKSMGRVRLEKNGPRIIDIDILFFNDAVIHQPSLTIPHPEIQNRRFALEPMADIAQDLVHPVFHATIQELLEVCTDTLPVQKLDQKA
jgi:2-amino-4-hydroxy-6-hydroxymethyldihydropteridine diphosphokinase